MFDKNKFKASIVAQGKSVAEVAAELGINESTLYRKITNDGNFTRQEIQRLICILNIEKPFDIFFTA